MDLYSVALTAMRNNVPETKAWATWAQSYDLACSLACAEILRTMPGSHGYTGYIVSLQTIPETMRTNTEERIVADTSHLL